MTPNFCRSSAEFRPNSHMLPSRTEPNIRPNCSAELRRSPNFGPSLVPERIVYSCFITLKISTLSVNETTTWHAANCDYSNEQVIICCSAKPHSDFKVICQVANFSSPKKRLVSLLRRRKLLMSSTSLRSIVFNIFLVLCLFVFISNVF